MNKTRTWVGGLCISAPCVILTLAMTPGPDPTSSGPVHGRVTYNGRLLDGGFILFELMERDSNEWAAGPIEQDGSYAIGSKWPGRKHGKDRFRICVVPRNSQPVAQMPSPSEEAGPDVAPMALSSQEEPDSQQSGAVESGFPRRFMNARTSGLYVTLGPEPARVDIDLTD